MVDVAVVKAGEKQEDGRSQKGKKQGPWGRLCRGPGGACPFPPQEETGQDHKGRQHEHRQGRGDPPPELKEVLQEDDGGIAQAHGHGCPFSRRRAPAHPFVDRAPQTAQAESGGKGGGKLERGALCRQQHRRPCEKDCQRRDLKRPAKGLRPGNAAGKGVGPVTQDDEDLDRIVDQLPLIGGEIALAGPVSKAQDGELEEDEGAVEGGQGKKAAHTV